MQDNEKNNLPEAYKDAIYALYRLSDSQHEVLRELGATSESERRYFSEDLPKVIEQIITSKS